MVSTTSRIEMEKFNGRNFVLWKIKMEDMLIDRDLWLQLCEEKCVCEY